MVEHYEKCGCRKCEELTKISKKGEMISKEIGFYFPVTYKKKLMWDVRTGKESGFTCKRQEDAEILSWLVRIGKKLGIEED